MGSNKSSSSKLKDRLARMFRPASLLRSSCNPSTSSAAAAAAVSSANTSSRALLADVAHDPVFVPNTTRTGDSDRNDLGRSFSFPITVDCGGCRPHHRDAVPPPLIVKKAKRSNSKNTKVERRVRENGGFYETGGVAEGRTCPPVSPSSPSRTFSASRNYYYNYNHHHCFNEAKLEDLKKTKKTKKKKMKKKLLLTNGYGFTSSSSIESDDGYAFFSSEEEEEEGEAAKREEETETFFSSKSFSSDSSEFYRRPLPKPRNNKNTKENKSRQRRRRRVGSSCNSCNVKEGFRPLVSVAANKEAKKKGFAVVKRSSDPYADFRTSMVEMIVERQIFGADDLELLLQSYLSLNSPRHHPVILQAFSDIWVALFGN